MSSRQHFIPASKNHCTPGHGPHPGGPRPKKKSLLATVGGAAVGGIAADKMGGGTMGKVMGAVGGAVVANKLEQKLRDSKHKNQRFGPPPPMGHPRGASSSFGHSPPRHAPPLGHGPPRHAPPLGHGPPHRGLPVGHGPPGYGPPSSGFGAPPPPPPPGFGPPGYRY